MKKIKSIISGLMALYIFLTCLDLPQVVFAAKGDVTESTTGKSTSSFGTLLDTTTEFIVIKHKTLGGSHYAYTESLTDNTAENTFSPGSQMVRLSLIEKDGIIIRKEEMLLESKNGTLRDPDVSEDGTKVLFSWKQSASDDYHIYEMDLNSKNVKQLTFGNEVADFEPKYLGNGKIIFSSTRCVQTVDCWWTTVSNLFICDADGSNIIRVGYDQVHTTYPTVTDDGRVLYTRWDYNDRTQMFVQGVFQMFPDGTNQTEVYGNGSNFPTTLLHTREVPGNPGLYISIAAGHHTYQGGKMVLVDTTKGRNNGDSVTYLFDEGSRNDNEDAQNQDGPIYKYPVAINDHEFLVSYSRYGWDNSDIPSSRRNTKFGIYYMNLQTKERILISHPTDDYGASQIALIKNREIFERPSMVNQAVEYGTYYMGNVYDGEGMKGVEFGTAKYLRIVELEFRSSTAGATQGEGYGSSGQYAPVGTGNSSWDVKRVLGIVDIEEDGSALFKVPANRPVYFQVLNADGEMIQTMRSWSTLMANETFSCVGCHEDKNTVPPHQSTTTIAMNKGVQTIRPDLWMTTVNEDTYDAADDSKGFSYTEVVQPILDANCISCHNNKDTAHEMIKPLNERETSINSSSTVLFREKNGNWSYYTEQLPTDSNWYDVDFDDSRWLKNGVGAFAPSKQNTIWNSKYLYARNTFTIDNVKQLKDMKIVLKLLYDEDPKVYLNGELIFSRSGYVTDYREFDVTEKFLQNVKKGENILAINSINATGGQIFDIGIYACEKGEEPENQVSLESEKIQGPYDQIEYLLSYLVLTGSYFTGHEYKGTPQNDITNWVSAMSQPTILDPYQYGSTQSALIERLKEGHGELTKEEIQSIAAWIDLGVPFKGSYIEAVTWNNDDLKEYYEELNKRNYYDMADRVTKRVLGRTEYTDFLDVTISYKNSKGKETASITSSGLVKLQLDSKLKAGDTITITLPEGQHYFYLSLNPRLGEAFIYSPESTFTYTIPDELKKAIPSSVLGASAPAITVHLATEEELATEQNLAQNPFDFKDNNSFYPHANTSSLHDNSSAFAARNAIDGFVMNKGHGSYPLQSWGPAQNPTDLWYEVNFGNTVYVSSLAITIRADFKGDHDTNFTTAELEFSDGSTQSITLEKTEKEQIIPIEGGKKATTSVSLKNLQKDGDAWAALTEVKVLGTVSETFTPTLDGISALDASWDTSFSSDKKDYNLTVDISQIRLRDLITANTDEILIRVNDVDVQYFADNGGAKINLPERENVVKIILKGNGGTTVYTLNITNTSVSLIPTWVWIVSIAGGVVLLGGVAALLILKPFGKGKKKAKSPVVETPIEDPVSEPSAEE